MKSCACLVQVAILFAAAAQAQTGGFIGAMLSDTGRGVRVEQLQPGSPAERAGLKPGDMVVAINGRSPESATAMTRTIAAMAPNTTAHLTVMRGGVERLNIDVVIGTRAGSSAAPVSALSVSNYSRISDPLEQAFTVEIPDGWRGEAGMVRHAALQIDPYVRALSPDKMTYFMIGDPGMPTFAPPSEVGMRLGFHEGVLYNAGLGGTVLIMRYLPGVEFAKRYGQMALGSVCPGLKLVSSNDRPELAREGDAAWPTIIPSRTEGGEAVFTCTHGGHEMEARVEAATRTTRDGIQWVALVLRASIAPRGQGDSAQAILHHIAASTRFNPAWVQMQNNLSQQAAEAINRRAQESLRQEAGVIQKLNAVDESFESMDEIITGTSRYHDAQTGRDYDLSNTNPYKWIEDSTGRIISTPTNVPPPFGYGFRPLPRTSR